ncbi:hypothetical protein BJF78_32435 [Pseudonocardia sp. CNS-139]|nr:hypothetical protein BJF78_32435 [Pseudonocardia sp. CNS-139]
MPLTPIMRELVEGGGSWAAFSQAVLLTTPAGLDADGVTAALQAVLDRHDLWRARLDGTALVVPPPGAVDATAVLTVVPAGTDLAALDARLRAELDPAAGVMVRAAFLDGAGAPGRLLLVAHHLVVDAVSWRIVAADLAVAASGGALPPVRTSFRTWAAGLAQLDRSAERPYWDAMTGARGVVSSVGRVGAPESATVDGSSAPAGADGAADPAPHVPVDRDGDATRAHFSGDSRAPSQRLAGVAADGAPLGRRRLDPALDRAAGTRSHTTTVAAAALTDLAPAAPLEVLVTALAVAVARWRDRDSVLLALETHGREEQVLPGAT